MYALPKKYFLFIVIIFSAILGVFFRSDIMSAIDTLLEGYRAPVGVPMTIDTTLLGGECRIVTAPTGDYDYFVPTKTLTEWENFQIAAPGLGFLLSSCTNCGIWQNFVSGIGGSDYDSVTALAIDSTDNIIVAGSFEGTGTDIFGASLTSSGLSDIWLAKRTPDGDSYLLPSKKFAYSVGGTGDDLPYFIHRDSSDNILISGSFAGIVDIFGVSLSSLSGSVFLSKLDSFHKFVWSKQVSGTIVSISSDIFNNIFIAGHFSGSNIDIFGQSLTSSGSSDIFLAKLDPLGNTLWVKKGGGALSDTATISHTDSSGDTLIAGNFTGSNIDIFGTALSSSGSSDIFLAKLDPNGVPLWSKKTGGLANEFILSMVTDSVHNIFVSGNFQGTGTDIFGQSFTSSGSNDLFLVKLDSSGDPLWTKKAGGDGWDYLRSSSMVMDSTGNILITGAFRGTGTDIFGSTFTSSGNADAFLIKLDPSGNTIWGKKGGGVSFGGDEGSSLAIDSFDNIYLAGIFEGVNSDIFGILLSSTFGGAMDLFLQKFDSDGTLQWAKTAGLGGFTEYPLRIVSSSSGNITVLGTIGGQGMDYFGYRVNSEGSWDIGLIQLDTDGTLSELPGSPYIVHAGGAGNDIVKGIAMDMTSNVVIAGNFDGSTITLGDASLVSSGLTDIFLAKFNPSGDIYTDSYLSKKGGGWYLDQFSDISSDGSGNILVMGYYYGDNIDYFGQTLTGFLASSGDRYDGYLGKFDTNGIPIWVKRWGNSERDTPRSVLSDSLGNIVLYGRFENTLDIFGSTVSGSGFTDIFLAKLDASGSALWAKKAGGFSYDRASDIIIDDSDNIYAVGSFRGTGTDIFGTSLTAGGWEGIYLAKFDSSGNPSWVQNVATGSSTNEGSTIALGQSGDIFIGGYYYSTDMKFFGNSYSNSGSDDIFLAKMDSSGSPLWVKKSGGLLRDGISSMATDPSGNIYISLYFQGTGTTIFGQSFTSSGVFDTLIMKLDPSGDIIWTKKASSSTAVSNYKIVRNTLGEIFVSGDFSGLNIDLFGTMVSSSGSSDIFLAKLDDLGNTQWVKTGGGTKNDQGARISLDRSGDILLGGSFEGSNVDIFGQSLTSSGLNDVFFTKLDSDGNPDPYFRDPDPLILRAGGTGNDTLGGIVTDSEDSMFLAGNFEGTDADFFGTPLTSSGLSDMLLAKLTSSGQLDKFRFMLSGEGDSSMSLSKIWTDSEGNLITFGYFPSNTIFNGQSIINTGTILFKLSSTGNLLWEQKLGTSYFNPIINPDDTMFISGYFQGIGTNIFGQSFTSSGSYDTFIAKLSSTGELLWAKKAGGISADYIYSSSTDSGGNIFVTGNFQGTGTDIFGQALTSSGSSDIFVSKLSSTGELLWVRKAGGSSADIVYDIITDQSGDAFVTGYFQGTGTDIFGQSLTSSGSNDIFFTKISSTGGLIWAQKAGGTSSDVALDVRVSPDGTILLRGTFSSSGADMFGQILTSSGYNDAFISQFTSSGELLWIKTVSGTGYDSILSTTSDSAGNILITGDFDGPSASVFGEMLSSQNPSGADIFLAKLSPSGEMLWVKQFGGFGDSSNYIQAYIDSQDNVLINAVGDTSSIGGTSFEQFIAKFTPIGDLLWTKISRSCWSCDSFSETMTMDIRDNILMVGSNNSAATYDVYGHTLMSRISGSDGFIAKLDTYGNPDYFTRPYIIKSGGIGSDTLTSIKRDTGGYLLLAGGFEGSNTNIYTQSLSSSGSSDIFLAKLFPGMDYFGVYTPPYVPKKAGGTSEDYIRSTASDSDGNIFVIGNSESTNINLFGQSFNSSGSSDIILAKLSSTGGLLWSKKAGGSSADYGNSIIINPDGSILIAGIFQGTNTDIFGQTLTSSGNYDVYLAKLTSTGELIWSKKAGGSNSDSISSIFTDAEGNILIAGSFWATTADIFGQTLTSNGLFDIFLAKLTSTGELVWSKSAGGSAYDQAYSITADSDNNVFVAGIFNGTNTNLFGQSLTSSGSDDIFLAKFSSTGSLLWAKKAGGVDSDSAGSIFSDSDGNILVKGSFRGTGTDIFGQSLTSSGFTDMFVAKLSSTGGLIWIQKAGGSSNWETINHITADSGDNILVIGTFEGINTDIFGAPLTAKGGRDIFLTKLSSTGGLLWSKRSLGSGGGSNIDVAGDIIIGGNFGGIMANVFGQTLTSSGANDIFISKLDSDGNPLEGFRDPNPVVYRAGGSGSDSATALATDASGSMYVGGYFEGIDTEIFASTFTSLGFTDAFLSKISPTGSYLWGMRAGGIGDDSIEKIEVDPITGNIIVTGYFQGSDADIFGTPLSSSGSSDVFVAKIHPDGTVLTVKKGGGSDEDRAGALAINSTGSIFIGGLFHGIGTDLFGSTLTSSGSADGYLIKLDPDMMCIP